MARKPATDLTDMVMDVLRGTPQKFKEIYAKVAQRRPEKCPPVSGDGRCIVKVADMQWLHQLERILEHVAVSRGVLWQLKEDITPPAANQKTQTPTAFDSGLSKTENRRRNRMTWKQNDVFPIVAEIIKQQYEQHARFITAREISTELLLNGEGRTLVEAARETRKNQKSLEWVASNMLAWLSARITRSQTEWTTAFERTKIEGRWAYKPSQP